MLGFKLDTLKHLNLQASDKSTTLLEFVVCEALEKDGVLDFVEELSFPETLACNSYVYIATSQTVRE